MLFRKLFPVVIISFLTGCAVPEKPISVFRYNESKDIPTLDPAYARNQTIIWPINQLYNGLVQLDTNLNTVSCIAKNWGISSNGLEYTFRLRNDVFFHDNISFKNGKGRQVVANDFVYSFNRIVNPKTASTGKWIFSNVDVDHTSGNWCFYADNDSTFRIVLKKPMAAFLGILAMKYCSVVPFEAFKYYGSAFGANPVGTGPFVFNSWHEGEKLIFTKNNNYFEVDSSGNKLPYLDGVAITFVNDKQSEFLEFLTGRIDFISGLTSANKDELLTRSGELRQNYRSKLVMEKLPYLNTEYLAFMSNEDNKSLPNQYNNILVRKAINCSFDRNKMMLYLRSNIGIPALNGFIPYGLQSFDNDYLPYDYSVDLAKSYLSDAGYENGIGLPELTLSTTSDYVDLCQFIQHQLAEVGITLNIDVLPGSIYREKMASGELGFFRGSWIADYPDAENYLSLFYSKNSSPDGPNYTRFSDTKYDKLFESAVNETDIYKRLEIYKDLNEYIMERSVIVPLYYDQVVRFYQKNIKGFYGNPLNDLDLKRVVKSDTE